jgi:hypothetical protein
MGKQNGRWRQLWKEVIRGDPGMFNEQGPLDAVRTT